jgi:hypothetical protein
MLHRYQASDQVAEDIHAHPWPFISLVLQGALVESIYRVDGAGHGYDLYSSTLVLTDTGSRVEGAPDAVCGAVLLRQRTRRAPCIYWGRAGEYHQIDPLPPATTLFIKRHSTGKTVVLRKCLPVEEEASDPDDAPSGP